jgi:integrase/recombinase XerD
MPVVEEEVAVPYTDNELMKLFATMDAEEQVRYKFLLGSGCRDKEVTFAAWNDIDFHKKTYHVRRKEDVHFTPKSHESRTIPLPDSLIALLRARRKKAPHERWLFINEEARPENHCLRKLKRIAKCAGLNCGQCRTVITEADTKKEKRSKSPAKTGRLRTLLSPSFSQDVRHAMA